MSLRKAVPFRHSPTTVADSLDETETPDGLMAALSNLVPDPSTRNIWVSRPAALKQTSFAGFTTPGFISCLLVVGTYAYGMVASARNAGKDEPFAYNLLTGSFATISGVTSANTPTSQLSSGAWVPPTMSLVGVTIVITHPGYDGTTHFVGWLNIATPAAPTYTSGNTTGGAGAGLPCVPTAAAQFNGRAYYLCNPAGQQPAAIATDVNNPTTQTNATYTLTFGDNLPLTAAAGLPLNTTLGGIVAALMIFKGGSAIFQVTGDFAVATIGGTDSTITVNSLNVPTGTLAPNSIVSTPLGLMFVSPDGLRMIDFTAHVSDPIGVGGQGIVLPLIAAVVPSRIAAAANASTLRIALQNGAALGNPWQEWWYHLTRKCWSGPHTFVGSLLQPYGNTFIIAPQNITASLWQSDAVPSGTSTYTENGAVLSWSYQTALLPVRGDMNECSLVESLLYMAFAPGEPAVNVTLNDENGASLGVTQLLPTAQATQWGGFNWGAGLWGGVGQALAARSLYFTQPIVFDRMSLTAFGQCSASMKVSDCYFRYQPLGYQAQP